MRSFQPALSGSKHHQQASHTTFNEACNTSKTACLYIINGKTVAFIPTSHGIILFDSYFHGISGAFVAIAPLDAAYELLAWLKLYQQYSTQIFHFNDNCQVIIKRNKTL